MMNGAVQGSTMRRGAMTRLRRLPGSPRKLHRGPVATAAHAARGGLGILVQHLIGGTLMDHMHAAPLCTAGLEDA